MSETINFPSLRPRRRPTPGLTGDVLRDISAPELIEANVERTMIASMILSLQAFGIDKTLDIVTRAIKAARSETNE